MKMATVIFLWTAGAVLILACAAAFIIYQFGITAFLTWVCGFIAGYAWKATSK